jgi:glutamate:GABA antiporter
MALPARQINAISGIPQALTAVAQRAGVPAFGIIAAALITVSQIGSLGAWITGTARLPFLFGLDRYLPKALGSVHPVSGSPHVALLVQGILATLVLLAAISGSAIREAYLMLIDMTVILSFLPLLYMFAALPVLRRRGSGHSGDIALIPGGPFTCWLVGGTGFLITLLALILAMVPPADSSKPALFASKVIGGSVALLLVGFVFYSRRRKSA